ncbi:MAG: A24 family peptidase, partial [Gammaproteobacteria bacterium]
MTFTLAIAQFEAYPLFFYTVTAVFGLLIGSFLNVVIYRLPIMMERSWHEGAHTYLQEKLQEKLPEKSSDKHHEKLDEKRHEQLHEHLHEQCHEQMPPTSQAQEPFNLVVPRSRCPHCNTLITAWQNIPVISYLVLRGRCHTCQTRISPRYPLTEAACGIVTVLCAWQFGVSWEFLAACVFSWYLIAATLIDYDHHLLPDSLTLPLMWMGLLIATVPVFVSVETAVLGAAFGYVSLWCVFWLFKLLTGKDGMGYGDFKLLAALGAWCGWQSLPAIIMLSSLVG